LDDQNLGFLSKNNLGLKNLNGEELKLIEDFISTMLSDDYEKLYFFPDFEKSFKPSNFF